MASFKGTMISAIEEYMDNQGCSCNMPYDQCSYCSMKMEAEDLAEYIIEYESNDDE